MNIDFTSMVPNMGSMDPCW